jgi:DNA ligase-1
MFKPMLAKDADLNALRFPVLASAKLDGIRAIVRGGVVLSRSLKPIPSKLVQSKFGHLEHYDGELIVGDPCSPTVFRDTTSHVMSKDKPAFDVTFHAFDHIEQPEQPYHTRAGRLSPGDDVICHPQLPVSDLDHLLEVETAALEQGYEGLILRDPAARYKFGRSTTREGILLKVKRFVDAEARVIGFEERQHNGNAATVDHLGHTKRSSHQANKVGLGDLGAIVADFQGVEIRIGSGFTAAEREEIWSARPAYLGKLVKFKYFPIGGKDKCRHPIFLGWRSTLDTSGGLW